MEEMWVCEGCKSINRERASRCYSCSRPRPQSSVVIEARSDTSPVLIPGVDDAATSATVAMQTSRGYVSAWQLGYLCVGLWLAAIVMYLADLAFSAPDLGAALLGGRLQLDDVLIGLRSAAWLALFATSFFAVVCHSVFLGIVDYDVSALGGGWPKYDPFRAGLYWLEATVRAVVATIVLFLLLATVLIGFLFAGLLLLVSPGFALIGGCGAGMSLFITFKVGGRMIEWLAWPRHLLDDLLRRLAIPGEKDSAIVNQFTAAWLAWTGTYTAALVVVAIFGALSGIANVVSSDEIVSEQDLTRYTDIVAVIAVAVELIAFFLVGAIVVDVTLSLVHRIRKREAWLEESVNATMQQAAAAGPQRPIVVSAPSVASVYGGGSLPLAALSTTPPDLMPGELAQAPIARPPLAQVPVAQAPFAQPLAQVPFAQAPFAQPLAQVPSASQPPGPAAAPPVPAAPPRAEPHVPPSGIRIAAARPGSTMRPPPGGEPNGESSGDATPGSGPGSAGS